ncbi:MAG: hypothetical protein Q7S79_01750, partial [bacterium]|nr:hypothetical protein [bacterium]
MQKKWVLIAGVVLIILGIVGFFARSRFGSSQAGILIQTLPQATVFIDGEEVGTTPYQVQRKSGDIELRLVPSSTDSPLSPWETKLTLTPGIETVVRRDFGPTDEESAGDVLSYEKV